MAIKELRLSRGIVFSLYDKPENFSKLERIMKNMNVDEDLNATMIVQDISNGLRDCDILIFLEDLTRYRESQKRCYKKISIILRFRNKCFTFFGDMRLQKILREEYEEHDTWYQRIYERMRTLSQQINEYAPCYIKIVFCSSGPTCLCATILRNLVIKLPETNIVVVSAHYGLEVIYDITESRGMNQWNFGCPPIWGFLGQCNIRLRT